MKKFIAGLLAGMIIASLSSSFAESSIIKLIINGEDITSSAQPTIIDGRTLVPARALAEKLGAKVDWDEKNRAVIVTSISENTATDLPSLTQKDNSIKEKTVDLKYNIGDKFTIKNTTIRCNSITYSTLMPYEPGGRAGFTANNDEKFAIIDFDVLTSSEPNDRFTWAANDFISRVIVEGKIIRSGNSTGSSMKIEPGKNKTVQFFISIPSDKKVDSIEFIEPNNMLEKAIVSTN